MADNITPEETQLILSLIQSAKLDGLQELEYKGLRLRFSAALKDSHGRTQARTVQMFGTQLGAPRE